MVNNIVLLEFSPVKLLFIRAGRLLQNGKWQSARFFDNIVGVFCIWIVVFGRVCCNFMQLFVAQNENKLQANRATFAGRVATCNTFASHPPLERVNCASLTSSGQVHLDTC